MKSKSEKRMNKAAKQLNKLIREDVFGTRFEIRQVYKDRRLGFWIYAYELVDNEQPQRNKFLNDIFDFSLCYSRMYVEMNNFIVTSDFWEKYRRDNYDKRS